MTTPTQAQIDAVKKRIKLAAPGLNENIIIHTARTIVTELAALTAAAQVDRETAMLQWLRRNATAEKEPKAKAAFVEAHNACLQIKNEHTAAQVGDEFGENSPSFLTAAAQLGDEYKPIYDSPNNRVRAAVVATIERCAQRLAERGWIEAADELSKMKDEP